MGQLMQIALTLYDVIVDFRVVDERQEEDGCHVTFRLDFANKGARSAWSERRCSQASASVSVLRLPAVSGINFFTVNESLIIN